MGKTIAKRKLRNNYYNKSAGKNYLKKESIKNIPLDFLNDIKVDKKHVRRGAKKRKIENGEMLKSRLILKIGIQGITMVAILIFCLCIKYMDLKIVRDSEISKVIIKEFNTNYEKDEIIKNVSNMWDKIYLYIDPLIPENISNKAIATFSSIIKKNSEDENDKNERPIEIYKETPLNIYTEENPLSKTEYTNEVVVQPIEDENIKLIKASKIIFTKPTEGVITSKFGEREQIFKGTETYHYGTDIANDIGTPIYSSIDGIVGVCSFNSETGKYIEINNGSITTRYCHLSEQLVKEQDNVKMGQLIGKMGDTGLVTGPHLHFEIMYNRKRVDAEKILKLSWIFMKFRIGKITFELEKLFIVTIALILIFSGIRKYFENYIICYLFVLFHELSHVLVAGIFGIGCKKITFRVSGMSGTLKDKDKINLKWLYIYLAGPISNLVLAYLFKNVEMIKNINISLAIINFLPLFPLDGANILQIILELFLPKKSSLIVINSIEKVTKIIIFAIGIFVVIKYKNVSVLLFIFYIVILNNPYVIVGTDKAKIYDR